MQENVSFNCFKIIPVLSKLAELFTFLFPQGKLFEHISDFSASVFISLNASTQP